MDSKDNFFMEKISHNFQIIKDNFMKQINKMGLEFDNDVFSDTIIKCNDKIKDEILDEELLNYFWIAFKNNTLRQLTYKKENIISIEEMKNDIEMECIVNDIFYDVSNDIIRQFGSELYRLFAMHANGTTYKDLEQLTKIKNIKYKFRCIREYIRKKYAQQYS